MSGTVQASGLLLSTQYSALITVFPNARIYFISSAHQCDSKFNQRTLVARRVQIYKARPHPGTPKLSGHRGYYISGLSRFVSHVSLLSRRHQIFRTRSGASVVLHNPDNPYDSRDCYRSADIGYLVPGSSWRFRQPPQDCSLDAAAVVICIGDRRSCLLDALPDLSFVVPGIFGVKRSSDWLGPRASRPQ